MTVRCNNLFSCLYCHYNATSRWNKRFSLQPLQVHTPTDPRRSSFLGIFRSAKLPKQTAILHKHNVTIWGLG